VHGRFGGSVIDQIRNVGRAVGTALGPRADQRLPWLNAYLRRGLTAFVFHEITDEPSEFQRRAASYTAPGLFERQVRWIAERFEVVAPTRLAQFGSADPLPTNAALITLDDSWAGVFRTGLPILESLGIPAVCFVNTATVDGAPDLGAVRLYERMHPPAGGRLLDRKHTLSTAAEALDEIAHRYASDREFISFQGGAATADDLARAAASGRVWFGLHLHHHWDLDLVDAELFRSSLKQNARLLDAYPNALSAFAPPYGRPAPSLMPIVYDAGLSTVFLAAGAQNANATDRVLDRITLPPGRDDPTEWWYETHRRRLLGKLARR
jgi:peptidoglycan/xylan/chitin deacetylase (PgdA/CDA1 family)